MARLGGMREIDQTLHFITYTNFTSVLILPHEQQNALVDVVNELSNNKVIGIDVVTYQTRRQFQIVLNQAVSAQTIAQKGGITGSIQMPALSSDDYIEYLDDVGQKRRARVVNSRFSNDSIEYKYYHQTTKTTLTQLQAHKNRINGLISRHITSIGW